MSKNSELYQKILNAANIIHQKNLNGSGNYVIIDSITAKIIEKYESQVRKKEDRKKKLKYLEKLSNNTYNEINKKLEERKKQEETYSKKLYYKHKKH